MSGAAEGRADRLRRRAGALVALVLFFHLTAGWRFIFCEDGLTYLMVSWNLSRGRVHPGKFPPGASIVFAPFTSLVDMSRWENEARYVAEGWIVLFAPALIAGLTVLAFHAILRRLGYGGRRAAIAAALLAVGSLVWPYADSFFAEPLVGLCVLGGLLPLARRDARDVTGRDLALAGLALGWACLSKLTAAPAAATIGAAVLARELAREAPSRERVRRLARLVGPALGCLALALLWNHARSGEPLAFGYARGRDRLGFRLEFLEVGLPGLLGSPGKGLVFYVPLVLVAGALAPRFARGHRLLAAVAGAVFAEELLLHAAWWGWAGEWAWGPRFLAPYLPPILLPLAELDLDLRRRPLAGALAALAIAASVGAQSLGVIIDYQVAIDLMRHVARFSPDPEVVVDDLRHAHFIPQMSPLVTHAWLARASLAGETPAEMAADCPWRGIGPPEWTEVERVATYNPMPPQLKPWVISSPVAGKRWRIGGELLVMLTGIAVALRRREAHS